MVASLWGQAGRGRGEDPQPSPWSRGLPARVSRCGPFRDRIQRGGQKKGEFFRWRASSSRCSSERRAWRRAGYNAVLSATSTVNRSRSRSSPLQGEQWHCGWRWKRRAAVNSRFCVAGNLAWAGFPLWVCWRGERKEERVLIKELPALVPKASLIRAITSDSVAVDRARHRKMAS